MNQTEPLVHRVIRRAVTRRPEFVLDDSRLLWDQLGVELIPIIGDGGFASIYTRSLNLAVQRFPWMSDCVAKSTGRNPYRALTGLLSQRNPAEATEALITVMICFTDILALLIGTSLTTRILCSAWGNDAFDLSTSEQKNER